MLKKIVVGLLIITIVAGAAFALLDRQNTFAGEPTAAPITSQPAAAGSTVGAVWSGSGTILELTSVGMTLALDDGREIAVELGPSAYWQAQGVTLNTGAGVSVDGFFNGTDYHARTVTTTDGAILTLRDANGQPLWSGSSGSQGQVRVPADEWVTVEGTVTALTNNGVIVQTTEGQTLTVSFGRVDFWQTQAVTFAVDDPIAMLGFWEGNLFNAGQVTRTATDERILLRDPNGRPLWAGPGRGQGSGNGGQGQHLTPTSEAAATAEAGQ